MSQTNFSTINHSEFRNQLVSMILVYQKVIATYGCSSAVYMSQSYLELLSTERLDELAWDLFREVKDL